MSIETELIAAKGHLDDCYDVVGIKGGTVPQNECLANLPTAINSIPAYIPADYGVATYEIDQYGELHGMRNAVYPLNHFYNITTVDNYGLYYNFYRDSTTKNIAFV